MFVTNLKINSTLLILHYLSKKKLQYKNIRELHILFPKIGYPKKTQIVNLKYACS